MFEEVYSSGHNDARQSVLQFWGSDVKLPHTRCVPLFVPLFVTLCNRRSATLILQSQLLGPELDVTVGTVSR